MKRVISSLIIIVLAVGTACAERVVLGAEQTKEYLSDLKDKRVALLSNHTGLIIQAKGDKARGERAKRRYHSHVGLVAEAWHTSDRYLLARAWFSWYGS